MKKELIEKYNVALPRYTSYPPANYFSDEFVRQDYRNAIADSNVMQPEDVSFYIHIPFCHNLCHYCGCNAMLIPDKSLVKQYMDALKQEINLILPLLKKNRKISQIHYGGGSPTSQPVSALKEINELLLSQFEPTDNIEIAIECHPAFMDHQYWNDLVDAGFNRISIGIQDFDPEVLKTVNRRPSKLPIDSIVSMLQAKGVKVNMDFIYGLPGQTPESFAESIRRAATIRPDRIVTFSYAHVPWVNPAQEILEKAGLPDAITKNMIYEDAKRILTDMGYKTVGMDHFVLPDDELYKALSGQQLHRNFQGYCTRNTTGQVYAFGISGISQLATAYSQNTKDIKAYIDTISIKHLPVAKGLHLNDEQQIVREVIATLMCNYTIRWTDVALHLNKTIAEIKAALHYNERILSELAADGLIVFDDNHITMLPEATPFVRNVAAALDRLMIGNNKKFSKVG